MLKGGRQGESGSELGNVGEKRKYGGLKPLKIGLDREMNLLQGSDYSDSTDQKEQGFFEF